MPNSSPASLYETTDVLRASGHPMRVERFEPPELAEAAVVILHGADGLSRRAAAYRSLARDLAGHGYRALLPHRLAKWLTDRGTPHEVKIYPGLGHDFVGAPAADARERIRAFLDRHLRAGVAA